MNRIDGIHKMLENNSLVILNKSSEELTFDVVGPGKDLSLVFGKYNQLMLMSDENTGDEFDVNTPHQGVGLIVLTDAPTLDRYYKKLNGLERSPLLVMLTGLTDNRWDYEIISKGRIFESNINYIDKTKLENTEAYRLSCALKRAKLGVHTKRDLILLKSVQENNDAGLVDVLLSEHIINLKLRMKLDPTLATEIKELELRKGDDENV